MTTHYHKEAREMPKKVQVNWEDVSESGVLPDMRANVTIRDWNQTQSQAGRLQYVVGFMVDEPENFRGRYVRVTYTVGGRTEDTLDEFDPTAIDAGNMKSMLKACQVPLDPDPEKCLRTAEGCKLTLYIASPSQKDKDAGFEWRNRINNYYKLGVVEVGLIDGGAKGPGRAAQPPMPPPPPDMPPVPERSAFTDNE